MTEKYITGTGPTTELCVDGSTEHYYKIPSPSGTFSDSTCERGCGITRQFRNSESKDVFGNEIPPTPQLNIDRDIRDAPARLIIPVFKDPNKISGRQIA